MYDSGGTGKLILQSSELGHTVGSDVRGTTNKSDVQTYYSKTDGGGGSTTRSANAPGVIALGSTARENRPGFMSVLWIMRVR